MTKKKQIIIHGHFYQPPRENPWTASIDMQESAAPFHDWNARVAAECYVPNARSRVLDENGRVLDVVNNYEYLSFNFGPTLLSYLEEYQPETYKRILTADQLSQKRLGFGNAMAQVYNHMIMPLANERDRQTQIAWGAFDFEKRYQRKPDGMWLAETAVNHQVMTDLARNDIRFTILAPSQAAAIRPLGHNEWTDVSQATIPTDRAYLVKTDAGDIAVFFYHATISQAVAFEHLLRNAATFADRIQQSFDLEQNSLVIIATDGESYGHHEPMGDMCLAYLATRELEQHGLSLTNPASYLHENPPSWEVKLKAGQDDRGTAWSCAHGVDRWREDCGCSTGGPPNWNQRWRAPLRKSFDVLRNRLDHIYEAQSKTLLKDPWAARDDYIQVLLKRDVGAINRFFDRHATIQLDADQTATVFRLLEMQHHGMLMYTSCGWFFAELSGLEATQNLRYFARAAQLGELLAGKPITTEAFGVLKEARSNIPQMGSGLSVLSRFVHPSMLTPSKVAVHQAIRALIENQSASDQLYGYHITIHSEQRLARNQFDSFAGRLTVAAERTAEGGTFEVAVIAGSELRLRAFVRSFSSDRIGFSADELLRTVENLGFAKACLELADRFEEELSLKQMLPELRLLYMRNRINPVLDELGSTFDHLYKKHEGLLYGLEPLGVNLPKALQPLVAYAASRKLEQLIERELDSDTLDKSAGLCKTLRSLGVRLRRGRASAIVNSYLEVKLSQVIEQVDLAQAVVFQSILDQARSMDLEIDEAPLQNKVFDNLEPLLAQLLDPNRPGGSWNNAAQTLILLAEHLNLNVDWAKQKLIDTAQRQNLDLSGSKPE